MVHTSYFLDSYTRFWRVLGARFLFSQFLHQILAASWCTILIFSFPTPGFGGFLVHYSYFLNSCTRHYRFLGVRFLFLLSLHHSPACFWCIILVFSFSTPGTIDFLVHYSCFLISYTRYYRFLGVRFLFSCTTHQFPLPYSISKSLFPVLHAILASVQKTLV